ncbi:hypothetical protein [Sphingomonas psychrolutea]|uniref:UrcA family protein n=1 Tax=Sphingomonas psychrolutea TaxID=1259676 RepID=A0ABQ1G0Z3_9SPHN|nr:hypothetical protein [Sphingomonas psychrolutea]GGA35260.1 hypothetical protein GCM10011395_02040 [Sphingomonas psychrolutea]
MMRRTFITATMVAMALAPLAAHADGTQDNSVGKALTQPLRDTRIKDEKIPEILQLAASAPYSSVNTRNCRAIAGEVRQLDEALGRDVDAPGVTKNQRAEMAALAARTAVNTLIPGLGIVRVLTGADKQQRRVEAAVYGGSVRRAYLKGIGLTRRCAVPAAPTAEAVSDVPELPGG